MPTRFWLRPDSRRYNLLYGDRSVRPQLTALALIAAVLACHAAPPARWDGVYGTTLAFDEAHARQTQISADVFTAGVAAQLDVKPQPFVIHLYGYDLDQAGIRVWRNSANEIVDRRIDLGRDMLPILRFALAHEMVHWHIAGTAWDRLPHFAEEGLADFVALQLAPECQDQRLRAYRARAARGLDAPVKEVLSLSPEQWNSSNDSLKESTYVLGYFIVERIGITALRRLCEDADQRGVGDVEVGTLLRSAGCRSVDDAIGKLRSWGR